MIVAMHLACTLRRVLFCTSCWIAATAGADWHPAAEGWTLIGHDNSVELYRKPVHNANAPAVAGHTRLRAPVMDVYRIVSDYDHFSGFIPRVVESRVLARDGQRTWVYQRLGLPLLFADRHYVIEVLDNMHALARGEIRISWKLDRARSASLPSGEAVLPQAFSGGWRLAAVSGSPLTDAVYSIQVDAGGHLPGWLVRRASERYVIQVIDAVSKRLARQNARARH